MDNSDHPTPSRGRHSRTIAGLTFRTQRELIEYVRGILHRAPPGHALSADHFRFMLDLLHYHPWADEKIGAGVRSIRVEPETVWGRTMMFVIERVDGSSTDFSFMKCLRACSPLNDVRAACRAAAAEDVVAFKDDYFRRHADAANQVICPLTGQRLGWTDAHVDHAPPWPFRKIVESFIETEHLRADQVAVGGSGDGEVCRRLLDGDLVNRFRDFHRLTARLRVVAAAENLRLG